MRERGILARLRDLTDAHAGGLLALMLAFYGLVTFQIIRHKPLWHDEIFTVALCRAPTLGGVWRVLESGVEQMPPLAHVLSRAAYALAPGSAVALRAPALIGFALLPICLYWTLRRRVPAVYALAGALAPLLTQALHFAYEARSYGVVLGLTGLAVLCWESAGERGRGRWLAITGLALAGAAAVSCHYYALAIVFPLAVGELVRTIENRRLDGAVWAALAAPVVPLLSFLPLIRAARSYASVFWARPGALTLDDAYAYLLGQAGPLFVGLAILWLGWWILGRRGGGIDMRALRPGLAVAAGFLLLPALGVASGFVTGAFAPRYMIWAVVGLALAIGYLAYASAAGSLALGRLLAVYLLVMAVGMQVAAWQKWKRADGLAESLARIERLSRSGLPVVYCDPIGYVQFAWYAPEGLNQRVYYLASPAAALRYIGSDSAERSVMLLGGLVHLNLAPLEEFTRAHRHFYVVGGGDLAWLLPALVDSGASVVVRSAPRSGPVYEVVMPEK